MRENGSYCIGFAQLLNHNPRDLLLRGSIANDTFFSTYFINHRTPIHIIQVHIGDQGEYYAVLKTRWIILVQRLWKRTLQAKQAVIRQRKNIIALRTREITGIFPEGMRYLPGIRGMFTRYDDKHAAVQSI